jgi:hypothetical protein
MAFVRFSTADVHWSGAPRFFASSSLAERGFCEACGTPLLYRWVAGSNTSLTINSLDDPEAVRPEIRYSAGSEVSWCRTLGDLPAKDMDVTNAPGFVSHQRGGA